MGRAEHCGAVLGSHGAEVAHLPAVHVGQHLVAEVGLVLHDAGDQQGAPRPARQLDRRGSALVGMDATEEQQVVVVGGGHGERSRVDAVVDRGRIVQTRVAIGVADGDVARGRVVALVDRHDALRREPVDGRDHRRVNERAVGEG